MNFKIKIFLIFIGLFFFPSKVHAITVTFSNPPSQILDTDSFSVDVTIDGSSDTEYYVMGRFTKENKTQYFGYTKNNTGNWSQYNLSDGTQFFKLKGNETLPIEFKADTSDPDFEGSGNYSFNLVRFSSTGQTSYTNESTPVLITINSASTPTPTSTSTPTPTSTSIHAQQPQIEISEVMACPSSGDEWVELKNLSNFEAVLNDWKIKDSGSYQKSFSVTIPANGYGVIDAANLNNDGDSVKLHNQQDNSIHSMSYGDCSSGNSWIQSGGSWVQTTSVTKNSSNQFTALPSSTSTPTPSPKPSNTSKPSSTPESTSTTTPSRPLASNVNNGQEETSEFGFDLPEVGSESTGNILGEFTEDVDIDDVASSSSDKKPSGQKGAIISILVGSLLFVGIGGYFIKEWYNKATIIKP